MPEAIPTARPSAGSAIASWRDEKRSAYLYRIIAASETALNYRQLFSQMAEAADQQAAIWARAASNAGQALPAVYIPECRVKIIAWLVHTFGARRVKPILAASKIRGLSIYNAAHQHPHNPRQSRNSGIHPSPGSVNEVGASHGNVGNSGGMRAAIFGVNDGLVSIACLIMGIAGANSGGHTILLTGLAGLLAGAFSMAAGEYISMRSQREMFEYQISLERAELAQYPEQEAEELVLIYTARGMPQADAKTLAARMIADPALGLDALAREELGLNPDELGSPWTAALSSFLAFSGGATIPLLPYLLGIQQCALLMAVSLSALALFSVGAIMSLFTGRSAWRGGLRMLLIGGSAALLTYALGHYMGAGLA